LTKMKLGFPKTRKYRPVAVVVQLSAGISGFWGFINSNNTPKPQNPDGLKNESNSVDFCCFGGCKYNNYKTI